MSEPIWTAEFQGAFEQIRYLLGDELLAFLTNTTEADAADPRTQRTVRKLAATLDLLEQEDPRLPVALTRKHQRDGLPLAWGMRQANGGTVPDPEGADDLERCLTTIARDVYPALLGPSDAMVVAGPGLSVPSADATMDLSELVAAHPLHHEVLVRLRATDLHRSDLVITTGTASGRLGDAATPSAILGAASRRLRHVADPRAAQLMRLAVEVLSQLRNLCEGEPTQVPAYIGLTAFPMDQDWSVPLPQGTLRAPTSSERRFLPFALQADAVIATSVACEIRPAEIAPPIPQGGGQATLIQKARELALAAALSTEGPVPRSCPSTAWIVAGDLGHLSTSYRPLHPERAAGRIDALTDDELKALKTWANYTAEADLSHVEIAVDRVLRALWEGEWTDSLIDSVIAWENLVGTRSETAYRVTAALSVLCQDDPHLRLTLRRRLAAAYDARSRLVHGDPPPADLAQHRDLAIEIALESLRRLMTRRRDLLALASSSKRADRLLLGVLPTNQSKSD